MSRTDGQAPLLDYLSLLRAQIENLFRTQHAEADDRPAPPPAPTGGAPPSTLSAVGHGRRDAHLRLPHALAAALNKATAAAVRAAPPGTPTTLELTSRGRRRGGDSTHAFANCTAGLAAR